MTNLYSYSPNFAVLDSAMTQYVNNEKMRIITSAISKLSEFRGMTLIKVMWMLIKPLKQHPYKSTMSESQINWVYSIRENSLVDHHRQIITVQHWPGRWASNMTFRFCLFVAFFHKHTWKGFKIMWQVWVPNPEFNTKHPHHFHKCYQIPSPCRPQNLF